MKPYYQDAWVTIYHGDCREVLSDLSGFDAFVTDPPYGVGLTVRRTKHSIREALYTAFEDTPDYIAQCVVPVVASLVAKPVPGCITPGVRCLHLYPQAADIGTIWSPAGAGRAPWGFMCSHPILYYGRDPYLIAGKGSRPNGMQWNNATQENGHPCPKPIEVMLWMVQRVTIADGQTVIDPFMGSGTTLRAAKDCGRKAIGIEIEERYCEIAAKRMAQEVFDFSHP